MKRIPPRSRRTLPHAAAFDEVANGIDKTARHSPKKRSSSAESAASDTKDLEEELTQLARAVGSRRHGELPQPSLRFLAGRFRCPHFPGVIAVTESLLPDEIARSKRASRSSASTGASCGKESLRRQVPRPQRGVLRWPWAEASSRAQGPRGGCRNQHHDRQGHLAGSHHGERRQFQSPRNSSPRWTRPTQQLASGAKELGYKVKRGLW